MWKIETEGKGGSDNWLLESLIESLGNVLEVMTGERPDVTPHSDEPPDDSVLWWEQKLDLAADATVWVGASRSVWIEMGRRSLEIAGVEDGSEDDFLGTYQELLQQTLSAFCQILSGKLGREVNCLEGRIAKDANVPKAAGCRVEYSGEPIGGVFFALDGGSQNTEQREISAPATTEVAAQVPQRPTPPPPTKTAELLLDVELPVSISFGRAHLPLRDVLKLTSGSIVELNRTVAEPVEVIVNNCVIARGEVVVVDGNYGVRIREIISREQRLRTLN